MSIMYRVHAIRRMFERGISVEDVEKVLAEGETVENYPDDRPYPSRLVLGFVGDRPLHVVCADDKLESQTIVVTVYEPDSAHWRDQFRKRSKS